MCWRRWFCLWFVVGGLGTVWAQGSDGQQDSRRIVQQAVDTELAANRNDHSHWLYFEVDKKADKSISQWVAETEHGNLSRVVEENGKKPSGDGQRQQMDRFLQDSDEQARQRKSEQHDDRQAEEMLKLLPQAFDWSQSAPDGDNLVLHFKPNPQFRAPDMEARVFAAMQGEMLVDRNEHRIVSLKGKMIRDVKIFGGMLGGLKAGGTFDVERRKTGGDEWQITETHVHIQGHALIFKNISEDEDDVRTKFKQLPGDISLQQAEDNLMHTQG